MAEGTKAFQTPSDLTIVAVGGCGKRLASHLCEHEWFLKEYLSGNKSLRFEVIDSDTNQRDEDKQRRTDLLNYIARLKNEKKSDLSGNISYEYYYIPDIAQIETVTALTASTVVEQIKKRCPIDTKVWWMHDPENKWTYKDDMQKVDRDIDTDFGGGVHRRRAISKAIFYKAITQSGDQKFPTFQGQGDIAIIVGLAGGTGSGMAIDLARYIRGKRGPETRIWLFALLPALTEGKKEQLNAAIALTEFEYLNLTGERLFNYIVLSSLGPTGFTDGNEKKTEVAEFDNAFPYLFINALYLPKSDVYDVIDAKMDYSGFIFADSHVIEYPIEELQKLKAEFEAVIDDMGKISKNRVDLNKKVDDFINIVNSKYPEQIEKSDKIELTQIDRTVIIKEIENVRKIWENDMTGILNYKTPGEINFYIKNNMDQRLKQFDKIELYDDLSEYTTKLQNYLEHTRTNPLENETDQKLYSAVISSLAWITQFATIQKRAASIKEPTIKKSIVTLLRGTRNSTEIQSDIKKQDSIYEGELLEIIKNESQFAENERKIDDEKIKLTQLVETKCNAVVTPVADYFELKLTTGHVSEKEKIFREKFDLMVTRIKQIQLKTKEKKPPTYTKDNWSKEIQLADVERIIDELKEPVTKDHRDRLRFIAKNVSDYYYYDYFSVIYKDDEKGLLKKNIDYILRKIFGEEEKITKENILSRKRMSQDNVRQSLDFWNGKISILSPFEIVFSDGFLSNDVQQKLNNIRDNIVKIFVEDLHIDNSDIQKILPIFEIGDSNKIISELKTQLNTILADKAVFSEKLQQIKINRENLQKQRNEKQRIKKLYLDVIQLVDDSFDSRRNYTTTLEALDKKIKGIDEKKNLGGQTAPGMYRTRLGEINPRVLGALPDKSPDLSFLDSTDDGKQEIEKLKNLINQKIKDVIDVRKLGISQFVINFDTNVKNEAWCFETASMVVSSPSHEISKWISNNSEEQKRTIQKILGLNHSEDAKIKTHNYTKPWEVALTFFATASFLDNISPMIAGGGYWEKYEKSKNNLLHHVLLLQQGKYIIREDLLKLPKAAEKANLERYEKDDTNKGQAIKEVLELYKVKSLQDAIKK